MMMPMSFSCPPRDVINRGKRKKHPKLETVKKLEMEIRKKLDV